MPLIAVGVLCYRLVVTLLLAAGAEMGTHGGMRWTLLRWSVQRDGKRVVKVPIISYYGVGVPDDVRDTPLIWAATTSDNNIVQLLLRRGHLQKTVQY